MTMNDDVMNIACW